MPMELRYPLFYLRGVAGDFSIPLELDTAKANSAPLFNSKEAADTFRTNYQATQYEARPIADPATLKRFLQHLQTNNIMLLMLNPDSDSGNVETVTVGEMLRRLEE